jgi:hypoxanthine phosphoribosyltransferase
MKPATEPLITAEEIEKRVGELAAQINKDQDGSPLTAICILKGSIIFFADLIRKLDFPLECEFIRVEMDEGQAQEMVRKINYSVDFEVIGKDILLVEDILDTGITLNYLIDYFKSRHAKSVKTCVMLNKVDARKVDLDIEYSGFEIPNKFVVGYGLDHEEQYRQLPYVTTIDGVTWPLAEEKE